MARHANFAAVMTVREDVINMAIVSYVNGLGPYYFPPPVLFQVGGVNVAINGIVEMVPPKLELHANSNNLVTVHFAFKCDLKAQISSQGGSIKNWTVQFNATVNNVGLITTIQNGNIILGIDTTQVMFPPFAIKVLKGSPIPSPILSALQSSTMAAAATNFVRTISPILISPPMLRNQIHFTNTKKIPFVVDLFAIRIVVKLFEQAITVAVDLAGQAHSGTAPISSTSGNPTALVDLTKVAGPGSTYVFTPEYNVGGSTAVYIRDYIENGVPEFLKGNCALIVNHNFISQIVDQISQQIWYREPGTSGFADYGYHGEYVDKNVRLISISLYYDQFYSDMCPQNYEEGFKVEFEVTVEEGPWFSVNGSFFLQPYTIGGSPASYSVWDDNGNEIIVHPDYITPGDIWNIRITNVTIDEPDWVDFAIAVFGITLTIAYPVLVGHFVMAALGLMGAIDATISDVEKHMTGDVFTLPELSDTLPGLTTTSYSVSIANLSFTQEGIDVGAYLSTDLNLAPMATIVPTHQSVYNKSPIDVTLQLRDNMKKYTNQLKVSWTVRRGDTKQVVMSVSKNYNDPSGNGVHIPHHSANLYHLNSFDVSCSLMIGLGNQLGKIWSGKQTITMDDRFDRNYKYIEWAHLVSFRDSQSEDTWYTHYRKSHIHRTAVSARCKMLKEFYYYNISYDPGKHWDNDSSHDNPYEQYARYRKTLPFGADDPDSLNKHRKSLCDYCFFGGPDKVIPFPKEDWF
jgi:hypothetical protein